MSAQIGVANPEVSVNNETVPVIANTFVYTEGKGEQSNRSVPSGGGVPTMVYSNDAETNFSMCKFSIPSIESLIEDARSWKSNFNNNVVVMTDPLTGLTRTFQAAALVNNYEVNLERDGQIELEFHSLPAV